MLRAAGTATGDMEHLSRADGHGPPAGSFARGSEVSITEDPPEVVELDLNPVLATRHDAIAVDCRVCASPPVRSTRTPVCGSCGGDRCNRRPERAQTAPILVTSSYGVLVLA
jgi:hypothetical protein